MKVLFAVNDENLSESIVKKYQKQYKEIISYKNVYFFNAILKELQKNKNYDRVVISEDLEEFTSSSYEQKDKFIFDKLDSISDEAVTSDGIDIPIILVCSERRNKTEDILVKLFGIGVYNAIIGEDRSIDEICRLIYKPRSKKEAKYYYKIDSEKVVYEPENESDVSEVEMQNILRHFKRLGDNEEKYAESFKNIVSQYNVAQLKTIISVLPTNVKEVLQDTSTEYQKLTNTRIAKAEEISEKNKKSVSRLKNKAQNGTSEKLISEDSKKIISKPIVVPTTMENNMYKKVEKKKALDVDFSDFDDLDDDIVDDVQNIIDSKPKKRGRPRKNSPAEIIEEVKPKRRGRPRKNAIADEQTEEETEEDLDLNSSLLPGFDTSDNTSYKENNILPGFEDEDEIDDDDTENTFSGSDYDEIDNSYEFDNDDENVNIEDNLDSTYDETEDYDDLDEDYNVKDDHHENNYINEKTNYTQSMEQYDNQFDDYEFESLLTGDKKIVTFVGTSKNGTSFMINNIAHILSNMGINTAILDATYSKNAYYIYTKNDEELRKIGANSIQSIINGEPNGIKVNNNLTVYTTIPSRRNEIKNSHPIMENLIREHSLILIDCDFSTPMEYFEKSQEIYLVQSMDVLTIQPLTEFLRELKVKNALDESKIRIVLNKLLRVKGVNGKNIVGGMSNYNDPEMSFMTELFDRNLVRVVAQIPFDEDVYAKYLEFLIECEINVNGYPKEFKQRLNEFAGRVYPLLPNKATNKKTAKKSNNKYSSSFSPNMNNTLENMRKKY